MYIENVKTLKRLLLIISDPNGSALYVFSDVA